jgi:hypothetical protein
MTIPTRLDSNQLARFGQSREQADISARAELIQAAIEAVNARQLAFGAQSTADGAVVIANGKNKTFYQTSAPTASATGDLWFDTDDNFKPYRWNGTSWLLVHDSTPATSSEIADDAVIASKIFAGSVTTAKIAAGAIVADKITANEIIASHMSVGQLNRSNLWPNPNSEYDKPASYTPPASGFDPEFDWRFNAGAGAYKGSWVRRMAQLITGGKVLEIIVPVNEGEIYNFQVFAKWISSSGTPTAVIKMESLDASSAVVSTASFTIPTSQTAWAASPSTPLSLTISGAAVSLRLNVSISAGVGSSGTIDFDMFSAVRALADGVVTTSKIADANVTGPKIAGGAVTPDKTSGGVRAVCRQNNGQSFTRLVFNIINWNLVDTDTHGAVTTGASWHFTVPTAQGGTYRITAKIEVPTNASKMFWSVFKNGTEVRGIDATNYISLNGSTTIDCVAGDTLDLRLDQESGGSEAAGTNPIVNWIIIEKVPFF